MDHSSPGGYPTEAQLAAQAAQAAARDARIAALDAEIAKTVRQGWEVQTRTDFQAVLTKKRKIGLIGNILLTLVTGGIWLIWVAYRIINRKHDTRTLTVDTKGKVRG